MNKLYRVNDIFYSLQGEGHNAGRAAVFVRFSGCNLKCPFCDTDFSQYVEMTAEEIVARMKAEAHDACVGEALLPCAPIVVLTGGEPTLQADAALIDLIHAAGFPFIAMESNGTREPPGAVDWLSVSPKGKPVVKRCDELKVVTDGQTPVSDYGVAARYYYLQPMDTGDSTRNRAVTTACVDYIKRYPRWRLSLQTHKLIGIK